MAHDEKDLASAAKNISGQANTPMPRPAHALTYAQVIQELSSDAINGLSNTVAQQRLEELGKNVLCESEAVSPLNIIIAQIANAMSLVCSRFFFIQLSVNYRSLTFDRCLSWLWRLVLAFGPGSKEPSLLS